MINLVKRLSGSYYRSNYLSFKLRKIIERTDIRKVIGFQLFLMVFIAGILAPQLNYVYSAVSINQASQTTLLAQNTVTVATFRWPLNSFGISQLYRFYHPAIDLTAPIGEPIFSCGNGTVESILYDKWGYGNHLIIRHDNGYLSLYAHLSQVLVKTGDKVTQESIIGNVGVSGWSTGSHLHFEIQGPEGLVNPLEVLPKQETLASS